MVSYTVGQIAASKKSFQLLDVCPETEVTDEHAVKFLDFVFAMESEFPASSVQEAIVQGLMYGAAIYEARTAFCRNLIEGGDAQK